MSFFGDLGKLAKKGIRKIKKVGKDLVVATRPIRPLLVKAGPFGAGAAGALTAADVFIGDERERKKKGNPGVPLFTPSLVKAQQRFFARTLGAGLRQARAPVTGPMVPTPPAVRVTPAMARPVPGVQAAVTGLPRRPTTMPLVPVRGAVAAQPAGLQLQVPRSLRQPLQTLREQLPFRFGGAPGATRAITPLTESVDKIGRPLIVAPEMEQRVRCPPGYLAVTMPDGSRACVLAGVAVAAGLAKRRKKPLISIRDSNAIARAQRAQQRLKRVTERAGFRVTMKGRPTRRRSSG